MFDYERVFYCPSFVLMGLLLARMLPLGTPPPHPPGFLKCFLLLLFVVPVHAERLDGAVEETKDGEEDEEDDQ